MEKIFKLEKLNLLMWPFNSKILSLAEKEAIEEIYFLIKKVLSKRRELKDYPIPYVPSFGGKLPGTIPLDEERQTQIREFSKKKRKILRTKIKW